MNHHCDLKSFYLPQGAMGTNTAMIRTLLEPLLTINAKVLQYLTGYTRSMNGVRTEKQFFVLFQRKNPSTERRTQKVQNAKKKKGKNPFDWLIMRIP